MNASTDLVPQKLAARHVPDDQRIDTLPRHFGRYMMRVEDAVYMFMRDLAQAYQGGYWRFYELSNGGFYMAPQLGPFDIQVDGNGYAGQMSADAAGITACLFAFSHLSFQIQNDVLGRHYYELRDFALEHAEARAIMAAID
ncbi:MAG: hypothetical protein JWM63_5284 [Gammaproteobacteria bacterium]|nr:hypothetical protein [Gammaproteobacteria bacterium]